MESLSETTKLDGLAVSELLRSAGSKSADWTLLQLAGDVSTRAYFRLESRSDVSTRILQVSEAFSDRETHAFLTGRDLFAALGARVPRVLAVDGARGWVLLEDLGDVMFQQDPSEANYRESLHQLVAWSQGAAQIKTRTADRFAKAPHWGWSFDFEKLNAEMLYAQKHLVEGWAETSDLSLPALMEPTCKFLEAQPRVLCHRDYHCRNLMLSNDQLWVIDFQDARFGPASYDLVSLLWDPYVRLSESFRETLVGLWQSQLPLPKNWRSELERMKVQRLVKACGSYAGFFKLRGRTDYLDRIPVALADAIAGLKIVSVSDPLPGDQKLLTSLERLRAKSLAILGA